MGFFDGDDERNGLLTAAGHRFLRLFLVTGVNPAGKQVSDQHVSSNILEPPEFQYHVNAPLQMFHHRLNGVIRSVRLDKGQPPDGGEPAL